MCIRIYNVLRTKDFVQRMIANDNNFIQNGDAARKYFCFDLPAIIDLTVVRKIPDR